MSIRNSRWKQIYVAVIIQILLLSSCVTGRNDQTNKDQTNTDQMQKSVYGQWQMLAIRFTDGRVMPGEYMGNPFYEFTQTGWRIKRLKTELAPAPDSVQYEIKKDSIRYIGRDFPTMNVHWIADDTLCLRNKKLSWYLLRRSNNTHK